MRNRFFRKNYNRSISKVGFSIYWAKGLPMPNSYLGNNSFCFLNLEKRFDDKINWNYSRFGKLWTFNLNYFDFLNQEDISKAEGLRLVRDYIDNSEFLVDGKSPYAISLRSINWIKFLSKNNIQDHSINQVLFNDFQLLTHNLEYHLLGNHLLENGFSLLFGAYFFKNDKLYKDAKKLLLKELNEQVLHDGGHFELSTMYHQIILLRVLDCIQLLQLNEWKEDDLLTFLVEKAKRMLSWLKEVTFDNGNIPMVNDSAFDIAPTSKELFLYADFLNLEFNKGKLLDSGYRMIRKDAYELFVDVGEIGASYQPAHVHSDTFNFVLNVHGVPIIVDRGVSTYEKNSIRQEERATSSHNTVSYLNINQSQVWGGFRVAKRANVLEIKEAEDYIKATHNGYRQYDVYHTRKFATKLDSIFIYDELIKSEGKTFVAHFHFHPEVGNVFLKGQVLSLENQNINLIFDGDIMKIERLTYDFAVGFNKLLKANKVLVYFQTKLETQIKL